MCRNIKTLYNFEPPATQEEVAAAALQYVRKVSGMNAPSSLNRRVFEDAVADIAAITSTLVAHLETTAPPKDREAEAAKARERWQRRMAPSI